MLSLRLSIGSTDVLMATSITTNAGGHGGEKGGREEMNV